MPSQPLIAHGLPTFFSSPVVDKLKQAMACHVKSGVPGHDFTDVNSLHNALGRISLAECKELQGSLAALQLKRAPINTQYSWHDLVVACAWMLCVHANNKDLAMIFTFGGAAALASLALGMVVCHLITCQPFYRRMELQNMLLFIEHNLSGGLVREPGIYYEPGQ